MRSVDVAIIGAGSAGLSARREVTKVTDNYVVIDDGPLGTTCARVGCMPSKVLIQVANDYFRKNKFKEIGIDGAENLSIDHSKVMNHVRKLRDRFVRAVKSDIEEWTGTNLIQKRAKFIDKNTLDLGDEKITAKSIILATGSSPIIPGNWRQYEKYFMDTNRFFEQETLPETVAVIGLGVIGIELGQALSRLGVKVIGLSLNKAIGGLTDPKIQDYAANTFAEEMTLSFDGADLVGEKDGKLIVKSGEKEFLVDQALLSMGRKPNVSGLGLENLDIDLDPKGVPVFSRTTFRVNNSNIFIAGDVNNDRAILHEASDEGRIAGYNAARDENQCFQRREFLGITFSDPNIAIIGKTHKALSDESADFVTGEVSYEGQGRAIVMLKEKGLVHIYADRKGGKILGAEMIAPYGEHMAHLISWAISMELSVHQILALPFYHPVVEEGLRTAFRKIAGQSQEGAGPLEVLRCADPPAGN